MNGIVYKMTLLHRVVFDFPSIVESNRRNIPLRGIAFVTCNLISLTAKVTISESQEKSTYVYLKKNDDSGANEGVIS